MCFQAPDYSDIIKRPMDLSTIMNKLKKYEYTSGDTVLRDIRLTFANCQQYNMPQTAEYRAGSKMSRFFEKRIKELKLDALLKSPTKASPGKTSPTKKSPTKTSPASRRLSRKM